MEARLPPRLTGKEIRKLSFLRGLPVRKFGRIRSVSCSHTRKNEANASKWPLRLEKTEARLPPRLTGKEKRKLGFLRALPVRRNGSSASSALTGKEEWRCLRLRHLGVRSCTFNTTRTAAETAVRTVLAALPASHPGATDRGGESQACSRPCPLAEE